jgi:hypothetical protein
MNNGRINQIGSGTRHIPEGAVIGYAAAPDDPGAIRFFFICDEE